MNTLVVGFDKSPLLQFVPKQNFLLIDDGTISDHLDRRVKAFDPATDSFNPMKGMTYQKAVEFIDLLNVLFPEGADTLTRRYSNHILFKALLDRRERLGSLVPPSKDPYQRDAYEKIERILLSDTLNSVLNAGNLFSFKGTIVARLDRTTLGDFDCKLLANLLISQFKGTVIIPDFGFYACPSHVRLMQQGRLIAGLTSFEQVPTLKSDLLMMVENKVASQCTPDDAETLALYCSGFARGTVGFTSYIERHIAPSSS